MKTVLKVLLVVINIIMLMAMTNPIIESNSEGISSDLFAHYETLIINSDYTIDGITLAKGTNLDTSLISSDGFVITRDYGRDVKIPFEVFVQNNELHRILEQKIQESCQRYEAMKENVISGFIKIAITLTVLSVIWFLITKNKTYCIPAYAVFTGIIIGISLNIVLLRC